MMMMMRNGLVHLLLISAAVLLLALTVAAADGGSGSDVDVLLAAGKSSYSDSINDADSVSTTTSNNNNIVKDEFNFDFEEFADEVTEMNPFLRYLQSSSTTETTRCNFWCQLKNSLGLTIVGLLLICIAPCLMWKNEGRHVRELRRIDFCKNKAVVVENCNSPSEEDIGRLVHFVGEVSVGDTGVDLVPGTALNLTNEIPKALIVKRTCYIYQKFEAASTAVQQDRIGGGDTRTTTFTVKEDWTPMGPQPQQLQHLPEEKNSRGIWDSLVKAAGGDSTASAAPTTPDPMKQLPPNAPPQMVAMLQMVDPSKAPHGIAVSAAAHVGGFGLTKEIVLGEKQVFQTEWSPVPANFVPDSVPGCEGLSKGSDGILRTFPESGTPTNGDVKVVYELVSDGFDASFVVEQVKFDDTDPEEDGAKINSEYSVDKADVITDQCFGAIHDNLGIIWMVRRGKHDLPEMVNMAKEEEKALTKILRIVCWVLLVAGWIMLFSIFTTVLSTLPLLGKLGYFAVVLVALLVGTLCCCTITTIAYFRYRPFISCGILALAGGIWGIVAWRMNVAAVTYDESQSTNTTRW